MILFATRREIKLHNDMRHSNQHKGCSGECLWGFSNIKHKPHSGGVGRAARRIKLVARVAGKTVVAK